MLTYSTALSTLQQTSGVPATDTTASALLIQFWNDSRRTVSAIRGGNWPWLEIEKTVDTVADQEHVYIPNDMRRVTAVRAVVGSGTSAITYIPKLVFDEMKWQQILAAKLGTNEWPYYCFQQGQKLKFAPIPSVTGTHIVLMGRRQIRDVNIVDYTTGSVVSIANGATSVVGTGTAWTASMAGRWIRITESDTANKGDGFWYEIASVESATALTLLKPYQGTSIAVGTAAYTIGQITYEPEAYQMAPIYRALAQYWDFRENMTLSERYWMLYDGGQEIGKREVPAGLIGQMLEEAGETFDGHYISPSGSEMGGFPGDYYYPWQQAGGFN